MKEWLDAVVWILVLLVSFALVVVCAYYATRLLGKRYGIQNSGSGRIAILDRTFVGQDRQILIVEVADKTMLIGVTANHIEKLCDLDPDQLPSLPEKPQDVTFKGLLDGMLKKSGTAQKERKKRQTDEER